MLFVNQCLLSPCADSIISGAVFMEEVAKPYMTEMFDSPENAERCAGTPRDGMFNYVNYTQAMWQQECDGRANGG